MCEMQEKIAYLKGLKDGLALKDEDVNKLMNAVVDALETIATHVDENDSTLAMLDECVEDIYDELDDVLYDDDDDDDEWLDDDNKCNCCDKDDGFLRMDCPHCSENICIDVTAFEEDDEITCPYCGEVIFSIED